MNELDKKPILVTGSHRSGSTWVGNMLALPQDVAYIHEPLNRNHRPGICKSRFKHWFPHICEKNESTYFDDLKSTLQFRYCLTDELKAICSFKDIIRLIRDYSLFANYRVFSKRPLVKDPIAIFSAEWLATRFDMKVVILIRHPAAFVSSVKKLNWSHPFEHFLEQPILMQRYLNKYASVIDEYAKKEKNIIDRAILLWNIIHHTILIYREKNPTWLFIRHEDLSRHPINGFRKLYNSLGLHFTNDIQTKIRRFSYSNSNIRKNLVSRFDINRDSKSNSFIWKTRLTIDEINKIKEKTHEIASMFYVDDDWH